MVVFTISEVTHYKLKPINSLIITGNLIKEMNDLDIAIQTVLNKISKDGIGIDSFPEHGIYKNNNEEVEKTFKIPMHDIKDPNIMLKQFINNLGEIVKVEDNIIEIKTISNL